MKKITLLFFLFGFFTSFAQDTCASAVPVTFGSYTVDAINGTDVPTPICAANGANTSANAAGEWYSFTSLTTVGVTITTDLPANICKDTRLHVYSGACGNLTCVDGDDDSGNIQCDNGTNTNSYLSTVSFNAQAGVTYYFAFDNKWDSSGFDFNVIEIPAPPVSFTQAATTISCNICAVVDMNNDKLDDIVKVESNQVTILTQNSTTGFTTTTYGLASSVNLPDWSIAAGDFDRNGRNDLVLGNGNRVTVLKTLH